MLRREPFRLFFPLGVLLTWAGVLHWLLLATGLLSEYRSIFHAMAQVQGFLACFAAGFLFTFIPRRTGAAPAATWELALAASSPVVTVVFAWREEWALSQLGWLVLMAVILRFALSRFRRAMKSVPPGMAWIPVSLAMGLFGSVITGLGAALGESTMWLHDLGRALLLQGVFAGLVCGVGSVLLPVVTRGQPPAEPKRVSAKTAGALHVAAALLFFASFWLEVDFERTALALRALIVGGVLGVASDGWRPPTLPGLHRRLAWIATWMLPLGFAAAAVFPGYRKACLHVAFIGCFALLAFAISIHVTLSHSGRPEPLERSGWQLWAMAALLAIALGARILVQVDAERFRLWLGIASASFLASTLAWAALVMPPLLRPRQALAETSGLPRA